MKTDQINSLLLEGTVPGNRGTFELVETHISWVLMGKEYVYKIKKPVHYSFLDFSSLEKRKFYCKREVELNNRLTEGIYLDVLPVKNKDGRYGIGDGSGEVIDYAVKMIRMDSGKQMDCLLLKNQVTHRDLENLAEKMALFHQTTTIISQKDQKDIQTKFRDLAKEQEYLCGAGHREYGAIIDDAVKKSDAFHEKYWSLIQERLKTGFVRDCHGDLHTRNIFLLPEPQPFDCIEFNDDYRQIDVLNDLAFLCMDLDYFERDDLSNIFIDYYNGLNKTIRTPYDHQLFIYFKSYRANIRAKINCLRAKSTQQLSAKSRYLSETGKYLALLNRYMGLLPDS